MENYAFVNEKTVEGKTYTAYRNINDPKDTIVIVDGETIKVENLKEFWNNLK